MMRRFDLYTSQYSTLNAALVGVVVLLAWGMLIYFGLLIPSWVWWSSLIFSLVGVGMYLFTRRLLMIRAFQMSGAGITALAFGLVFWAALSSRQSYELTLSLGVFIALTLAITALGAYYHNKRRLVGKTKNPVGMVGTLDPRTATIARENSGMGDETTEATNQSVNKMLRYGPAIAGLSLLFARSLSADGVVIVIGLVALVVAYGAALGAGGMWYYTVKAINWEREHGKRIYVKR